MNPADADHEFEALLEYLKRSRLFDFTGYKRASLMRRVRKRMQAVGIERFGDYVDYLEVHADEFAELFNTILINVTAFFRDAAAWEYLRAEALPHLIAAKRPDEPVRVWSAGCASGEEAYTLAIVLAETLGLDQFRERVKIYATDVDEEALNRARHASYAAKDVTGIPQPLLDKYFERSDNRYVFRKDLRRSVIFGRHDLIQDAPISRIDLLVCRNTLMYFNAETQARILARFSFALNDGGMLFLGRAEMLFSHPGSFVPLDLKRRVFTKLAHGAGRERLFLFGPNGNGEAHDSTASLARLRDVALDAGPVAEVVIDLSGRLVVANERARALFSISSGEIGAPFRDAELSYRPIELRSRLDGVLNDRRTVTLNDIEWPAGNGERRWLDVQLVPLSDANGGLLGVSVTFTDVTRYKRLQEDLERSNQELEAAYEELQSTNEELETTNEELQSTVEELETTNEELQSTNEELETMNEELQSTNEELQTINEELRRSSEQLNQVNGFLESILASMRGAVVVLNRELEVLMWNHRAEDLWGLRRDEVVGKHFLNLDVGLPVEQLRQPIRQILAKDADGAEVVAGAVNRRGKAIQCAVTCMPLTDVGGEIRGALLLMDDVEDVHPV